MDVGGERLYYYAAGSRGAGDPVLFLHGFALSASLWRDVIPLVPVGYRSIAVDLAAHGRSEVADTREYDAVTHARLVENLLAELRVSRVNLVAHGAGCEIATKLAHDTARVAALLLIAPTGAGERAVGVPPPGSAAARALPLPWRAPALALLRRFLLAGYADRTNGQRLLDRHLKWFEGRNRRRALARQLHALAGTPIEALRLEQPTEVLLGDSDPYAAAGRAADRFLTPGHGAVTTIGGQRHFLPEEAPDTVARVLSRLLSGSGSSGG